MMSPQVEVEAVGVVVKAKEVAVAKVKERVVEAREMVAEAKVAKKVKRFSHEAAMESQPRENTIHRKVATRPLEPKVKDLLKKASRVTRINAPSARCTSLLQRQTKSRPQLEDFNQMRLLCLNSEPLSLRIMSLRAHS